MASETKRGCGFRRVGGLYLMGSMIGVGCDRLPLELTTCPACGHGVHFTRSLSEINALQLLGKHDDDPSIASIIGEVTGHGKTPTCQDKLRPCTVCDPEDDLGYVMMVGARHYATPQVFMAEAHSMGISKRIPFIPKKLKLGKTVIYLAHPKACRTTTKHEPEEGRLIDADTNGYALGIFCAFRPTAVEMPVWESDLKGRKGKEYKAKLEKRGITPVSIEDGDKDHK